MSKHNLIFIHGMGEARPDGQIEQNRVLFNAIGAKYDEIHGGHPAFHESFQQVDVIWFEATRAAEEVLLKKAYGIDQYMDPYDWKHWAIDTYGTSRSFMTAFLGDVAAYVSEDDNGIRKVVWNQLEKQLDGDFSIIAHSLGSAIAFDFVFNLMPSTAWPDGNIFLAREDGETEAAYIVRMQNLSRLAPGIYKKFHNLFTYGSPIGLFMMRKGAVWMNGRNFAPLRNPVQQGRWLNFVDRADLIAVPLEGLFRTATNNTGDIHDVEVHNGPGDPVNAHLGYPKRPDFIENIAAALAGKWAPKLVRRKYWPLPV